MSDMTSRDFILQIATEMNRTPEQMKKFINLLEDNMIDTVESLKELSDQDYKDMGFPIGLVNKMKKRLQSDDDQPAIQAQPAAQAQSAAKA